MITGIELGNIRLFEDVGRWDFPFSQLSVLCGTNSAGKSTVLKSLLLLVQSNSAANTRDRAGQLKLMGPLVDLGTYKSLVSHQDVSRDITVSINTTDLIKPSYFSDLRKISGRDPSPSEEDDYMPYRLKSSFCFGVLDKYCDPKKDDFDLLFKSEEIEEKTKTSEAYLKRASFRFETEEGLSLEWEILLRSKQVRKMEAPDYEILIPGDYLSAIRGYRLMEVPRVPLGSFTRIECFLRGILPSGLWAKSRRPERGEEDHQEMYFPLPPLLRQICSDFVDELEEIHYIGPLRSPAKRYYFTPLDSAPQMDAAGDFLPYVFRDRGEINVYYIPPGDQRERITSTLATAINVWLHYLRTGESLNGVDAASLQEIGTSYEKDVLFEFTLKSFGEESHSLADSGFGYSQLLPIVVRGLIAEIDDTIIIEQPELHLNPALQVRLAEFLAALALTDRNLIIETHSEHIVNALRVLAAEDLTGRLSSNYAILYLDTEGGRPTLRHLEVEEDGTIPEWPRAFMGEAMKLSSRLLKAQDRKYSSLKGDSE